MTVIDEEHGSAEYSDMEFVEFLEFLVRIAYVYTQKDGGDRQPIENRLKTLL